MEIAKQLAGYTLGGADLLRRAMGKKIKAEMDAQRETFIAGAVARGIDPEARRHDLRRGGQVRLLRLQQEPRRRLRAARLSDRLAQGEPSGRVLRRGDDHRVRQPREAGGLPAGDARRAASRSTRRTSTIRRRASWSRTARAAPASAMRWRRSRAWERPPPTLLVEERNARGPFRDLADLMARLGTRVINKRLLESLARAGALDCAGAEPAPAREGADALLRYAAAAADAAAERPGQPVRRQRDGPGAQASTGRGRGLAGLGAPADGVRRARASTSRPIRSTATAQRCSASA